ncbi:phage tail tape measure protein [Roseburia inulinivorans]|jgi:TP901 family phage tail tape measure protein|uniref:phage tail tape measure protein n=1 Tax=Roseburia inulinivorans TaxID=360807 RepID=UPI0032C04E40
MADEIKLKAPTVEQQVVVNINGEDKLKSFADTLDKISNNKNLQKYWKTQQDLINATADAYSNFQKKASKDNASELIKVTNALKAMSGTDLSHILPDFDKISKSMSEAQKVAGNIDSAFSVKGFKEAFDSFETLKAYGTDVQKLFSHFGVSSDIGELQQNVRLLEGEVERLTGRLSDAKNANEELRNEFENFKVGSGFADKLDELDRLKAEMQNIRDEATQTFNQFLDANKIDRYDWFSDDRFAEYFEKLENGTLTATDAIRRFKSEYSYLLEDSYKSNGDSFGLDQLQVFSTKFDSIFHQVEETSNKINDILSNGVIAKSVQNLSEDTTLSDSQRSIFGNILQDEESLKSITALFQKLIDETNQTKNTEVFNTEQFTKLESLFRSIESSLSSIKGVLVDVGDGEELSPLLKQLDNIREATSNIKLSLNLDLGNEVSERLNQKVSQSTQRQLEAYRKLFSAMKGTGKTNKEMLKFFEPDEASATELIGAYQGIIKRAEEKFKVGNSNVYKKLLGSTYDDLKKEIKNANAQLGRAENKRSENGILGDLFGNSKDLSGVIEQLNTIVSKLDEISVSAKGFTETLKNGLNVNASVDEIEKLTNRVKELESELAKIKTPTTIPSKDMKDAFPDKDVSASVESATNSIKEENNVLEQNTQKVKKNTQAKEQNANVNLNKYDKHLDSYNGKVDKYQATIDRFNDGGWTSDTYLENVQAVRDAVKQYATLLDNIKTNQNGIASDEDIQNLDKYEKKIKDTIATVTNMSASEKGYSQLAGQKEIDKINKILRENSAMTSEAKAKIKAYKQELISGNPSVSLEKIHGEIMKIVNAEELAGRAGRSFFDTLKNSGFHQIAAQMAGMFGVYDVINLGKEGFNVVRELNTALTEMRKVSDETVQSLKDYQATTFDTADAIGTTAKQIQNSTADWMRLGESMNQAAESAKDANVLLNVSEFEGIDEATESLVSMSQAYKDLDKMDIIDVLNNIGNNYSISTDGLATALKDSASALVTANNDLNEAVSLTTAGNAITQDPSKVGAGLRTISLRLVGTEEAKQELSDLGEETDGMITTVSKLRDTIMDATKAASSDGKGFDILDSNGNYKSTYEIMQGLADLYDNIVKKDKELGTNNLNLLLETIAGKNRANIAASILQNGDMLRSVYKDAQNSEGSAEKELNSYLDSIDGKMAQLENRTQEFWFKVIDSETIKNGIDLLSTLLKGATDFVDTVGLLPTILTGIGAALSFKNVGRDKMYSLSF